MAQRLRSRHRPLALAVVLFSVLAWLGLGSLTHAGAATASGGDFFPVAPAAKIVDTRSSLGVSAALGATSTASFQVLGQGGVPASGVAAVSLDITAANATSSGSYLQMWPDGTTRPYPGSVINFSSSADTSNSAIIAVGSDGKVDVYNSSGTVDVIVSVNGYFTSAAGTTSPGGYVPVTPARIVDTRDGTGAPQATIAPGGTLNVQVDGVDGVTDEASVYANITVPSPGAAGSLYAYATGASPGQPTVSYKSVTTAQGTVVPVGTGGQITLKNGSSTQSVNVVIDIYGYFTEAPSSGGSFTAVQDRLLDTRTSTAVASHSSVSVAVGGNDGIPTTFGAAVLNLTTTSQEHGGFLQVWGTGPTTPPGLSVDNFQASTTTADQVIVAPGTQGAVTIYNDSAGTIQLIVDLQGWFSSDQTTPTPDPTDTAPDPTASDPGPKPSGAVTVSPGPTVSGTTDPTSTSTPTDTGAATVGGKFTNASGVPQQNLSVSVAATDGVPDDGTEAEEPVVGTATTGTDGTWSLTLPDPLPSTLQTLADANGGVLNLEATASGSAANGTPMVGMDFLSAGVAHGSNSTTASAEVRADETPHTTPMYVDTVTTDVDNAPTDAQTATSEAQRIADDASNVTNEFANLPTWQSATGDTTAYSANVVNGTDYSSATVTPYAACHNNATTLHSKIVYTTVGEAHAYYDAKASFDYTDTMSTSISLAVSTNQSVWTLSGESTQSGSIGHSTGYSGKGPYYARQWQVPILYKYQRVHTVCAHQNTRVWYRILPSGYKIPAGGAVGRFGKDVSSKDGYTRYAASNSKWRFVVPQTAYYGLSHGNTSADGHGVSVWGVGLKVSTSYDSKHTQKIEAGKAPYDHDVWGGHGPLDGNPGVFYSY
ncbi:hypothetical protein [Streptomyces sp. NPDC101234]|uniref:hypothetical protein n=1 Tax=Streptomyces sp. NPDC101234 TaxID=3366138 RepID=UPI0037F35133